MQYIPINQPTKLVFTLYELCSNLVNPYFTFTLRERSSNQCYTFSQVDFSNSPYYYNSFTFSMSSTMSGLTAGIVQAPFGQYEYNVYEMATYGDLNINNAINLVETGIWNIVPTYSTIPQYTTQDNRTTPQYRGLNRN